MTPNPQMSFLELSTSQYSKKDFRLLRERLSNYSSLKSAKSLYDILEFDDYLEDIPKSDKEWTKRKIIRLDMEYPFVVDFLQLPFTQIPLVVGKYGNAGVASIILRWRLEIGK